MSELDEYINNSLKTWEALFKGEYSKYHHRLHEWFIIERLRMSSNEATAKLYEHAPRYPLAWRHLQAAQKYLSCQFEQVFPAATQQTIETLRGMAQELLTRRAKSIQPFANIALNFEVPPTSCLYYRDVRLAFRAASALLKRFGTESPEGEKVLRFASSIIARADMTSVPAVDKILALAHSTDTTEEKLEEQFLLDRIQSEETDKLELKETLGFDVASGTAAKRKEIEGECLRAVAAFLNADGGLLLIGVSNLGVAIGVERDLAAFFSNSPERLARYFQDQMDNKLGMHSRYLVQTKYVTLNGKRVLHIECQKGNKPTYLKNKFYKRGYARSVQLEGEDLVAYLEIRFPWLPEYSTRRNGG